MTREWYRSIPASGLVLLLVVALWTWRAETASGLERLWIGMMAVATGFGLWGLARALQTRGWVNDEQYRHPDLEYGAARAVAQTHAVTHACILATTLALLAFGVVAALTVPPPGQRPSHVSYALTGALLVVGAMKTFLNVYLVIRREALVRAVQSYGGD